MCQGDLQIWKISGKWSFYIIYIIAEFIQDGNTENLSSVAWSWI